MSPRQRVVVAGGMGSGKSTVMATLSRLGWIVISGDDVGHETLRDPEVVASVTKRWPGVLVEGEISRSELARVVFSDRSELDVLEEITHPHIGARIGALVEEAPEPVAVEISVLKVVKPRWGSLLIVHAPLHVRRQRALDRGMKPADIDARLAMQPSDSELLARADLVIDNQGAAVDLEAAVRQLDLWSRS